MNSKLAWIITFIIVLVVGVLLGMFLMYMYQSDSNSRLQTDQPCMEVRSSAPGSNPNAWATEPFTFSPVEQGIYYPEPRERETRHESEL